MDVVLSSMISSGIATGLWYRISTDYSSYSRRNPMITKAFPKPKHISNEDKPLITKNHFINYVYFILFFELVASVAFIVKRIKGRTRLVWLKERNDEK
jgi:hypothetical protein